MLIEKVWAGCVKRVNQMDLETEALAAEKALAILTRQNVLARQVVYKRNSFRIQLSNTQFRVYRIGASNSVWACPWPTEKRYEIQINGSLFAEFLLLFDKNLPEILSVLPDIINTLKRRERELQKKKMAEEIKTKHIQANIDQFLKPLGLEVRYSMTEDDVVRLNISQTKSARLEIPLRELTEQLKDPAAILEQLE